jgi:hypothetical protein
MDNLKLTSGFVISIKQLSPYYLDFITEAFPMPDFPVRKIKLFSGDIIDYDYVLSDTIPSEPGEELDLYLKYKRVEVECAKVEVARQRAKRDYLLATCVFIEDGPIKFEDKEWEYRMEAAFPNYKIPTHPGRRALAFLKGIAITSKEEMEMIISRCLYQEVDMQSIITALQGFRSEMAR